MLKYDATTFVVLQKVRYSDMISTQGVGTAIVGVTSGATATII